VVTDSQNCEATANFTINVRDQEFVMIDANQGYPFCFNDDDGAVLGYNPEATNYILSLNGFNVDVISQSPFLFEGLAIGTYDMTVNIQLSGGQVCTADTTFSIEADSPEIFINVNPPAALGCLNQEITFESTLSGGTGNFTTYWNSCSDAAACQIGVGDLINVVLSSDTTIYVYGVDAIGCSSDTIAAVGTLSTPPSLLVQNGIDTLQTCQYDCELLTSLAIGGTGALSVEWYTLGGSSPIAIADTIEHCFVVNQLEAFEVHLLDGGCSTSLLIDTLWVRVHDTPEPIMSADEAGNCYPDTIGFYYDLLDPTYSDAGQCVWSLGNGTFINYCGDTSVVYTGSGEFYPSITITSQYGCVATDTLSQPIVIRGYPEVDFTWSPQPVDILHRQVHFQNLTAGADSIYWDFYSAGESYSSNPFWTFPDIETTTPYRVCLTAGNEFGCLDTLCQEIYVENILQVFIPNTFTPDGDGLNDVFLPVVNGELDGSYRFWVFNRWGDTVFYTEEVGKAWTGGYDGGTFYIPDGYYLWKVQVESLETGKLETFEGEVIIIR
jgi:gliding motility-associated-like protein